MTVLADGPKGAKKTQHIGHVEMPSKPVPIPRIMYLRGGCVGRPETGWKPMLCYIAFRSIEQWRKGSLSLKPSLT
jgi:hypothetical protein